MAAAIWNMFILVLIALELFGTYIFGVFSIMAAGSNVQLFFMTIIPTAIFPIMYFLIFHGLSAKKVAHKALGIISAFGYFCTNAFLIYLAGNIPKSTWPEFLINPPTIISVALVIQFLLLVVFRSFILRRINSEGKEELVCEICGNGTELNWGNGNRVYCEQHRNE